MSKSGRWCVFLNGVDFRPVTVIIEDGQTGDCFYFLAEGELKVLKNGMILDLLTTGECFGEMAVIGKRTSRRGADIIALTAAKLVTGHRKVLCRNLPEPVECTSTSLSLRFSANA
jgi:CRP-like cAMP-binding protein